MKIPFYTPREARLTDLFEFLSVFPFLQYADGRLALPVETDHTSLMLNNSLWDTRSEFERMIGSSQDFEHRLDRMFDVEIFGQGFVSYHVGRKWMRKHIQSYINLRF